MKNRFRLPFALVIALNVHTAALGHETGAPFSGAIIDPLEVHHAHIEDEQRLNFEQVQRFRTESRGERDLFLTTLELATRLDDDFRSGMEVFIPYSEAPEGGSANLGDIEFQPYKYSFQLRPDRIFTGVIAFRLPTGDEAKGLSGGQTVFEPHVYYDRAWGNWYLGINAAIGLAMSGPASTEIEHSLVVSHSFIRDTVPGGLAPTRPHQDIVPAISIELLGESGIGGEARGERVLDVLPGLNLWHPASGWTARVGARIPVSEDRESGTTLLFQIGNHLSWRGSKAKQRPPGIRR